MARRDIDYALHVRVGRWLEDNAGRVIDMRPAEVCEALWHDLDLTAAEIDAKQVANRMNKLGVEYKRRPCHRSKPSDEQQAGKNQDRLLRAISDMHNCQGALHDDFVLSIAALAKGLVASEAEIRKLRVRLDEMDGSLNLKLGKLRDIVTATWMRIEEATSTPKNERDGRKPIGGLLVFPSEPEAETHTQDGNGTPAADHRRNGTHGAQG